MHSDNWNIDKSDELYSLKLWGAPYFSINSTGHLVVSPQGERGGSIDLYDLVKALKGRGLALPILLRFPDILQDRIDRLNSAFARAIARYNYQGIYRGVFPVKVNQQRHVIEGLVDYGEPHHFGLEAGSKPELLIALSYIDTSDSLIICNGYKDHDYLETAILASRLNKRIMLILEQLDEVCLAVRLSKELNISAEFGFRVKLNKKSQGHWSTSVGERSKFGMSLHELYQATQILINNNMLDSLKLLHFHAGSQLSAISTIKGALREAGRIYVELVKLGAPMGYLDVGGGLAVDYDGSKSDSPASKNYNIQNYANDVVAEINDACRFNKIPAPTLISESGRALASHQAVLIFDVLGQSRLCAAPVPAPSQEEPENHIITTLREIYEGISTETAQESFHDVLQYKAEAVSAFQLGVLSLKERVLADKIYWQSCRRIYEILRDLEPKTDDFFTLEKLLATTYYVNLSVFQSAPDSWALDQLFPIMPIHRLNDEPTEKVTLADLTCDSDGKIDKFIDLKEDTRPLLDVHPLLFGQETNFYDADDTQVAERLGHEPYYLGMFLVGAYQETMGNLHNLFGDTNVVHIKLTNSGYKIEYVVKGDTTGKVLSYFQYNADDLVERMRQQCEEALSRQTISLEMSQRLLNNFSRSLASYTYIS